MEIFKKRSALSETIKEGETTVMNIKIFIKVVNVATADILNYVKLQIPHKCRNFQLPMYLITLHGNRSSFL